METLKKIAKGVAIFGTVGFLLALSAPTIADVVGMIDPTLSAAAEAKATSIYANALWEGAFFGTFGGIHAAVAPVIDWVTGSKSTPAAPAKTAECSEDVFHIPLEPELANGKTNHFAHMVEAQKAAQTLSR